MGADSKPISHDEIAEDGILDPLTDGFEGLIPVVNAAEAAMISFAKNGMAALKGLNFDDMDLEGVQKFNDQVAAGNSITEQSIKLDKLKAQSAQAEANARKAQIAEAQKQFQFENQVNAQKQKSIVLSKEQIAQKQIDAAKDREAIALIKAKIAANNETLGSIQRIQAANAVLRNEQKNLNLTTAEGVTRNGEINNQLDLNNGTIKKNADALKQQAMNVGNYSKSFSTSLRPIEELVRGLGYALGIPIEGLREYTGVIRGASDLNDHHKKTIEGVKTATEKQTTSQAIQLDETGNVIKAKEADIVVTEEQTAAQEAAIPVIGLVIGGIALLAAGIDIAIEATDAHRKAIDERSVAVDGSIIRDKKQRDDWNEYVTTMKKLGDEYQVLIGHMGDYEAAMDELENNASVKVRDLKNEMADNIQTQTDWFRSIHGFFNNIADIFTGDTISTRIKELTDQYEGAAGVITRITDEMAEQEKIAAKKRDDDVIKSNFDLLDSEIENAEKIADVKNEAIRNDYERNKKALADEKEFSKQKIENKIAEQEALNKANTEDISGLQGELQTKRAYKYTSESQQHFDADNAGVDKANADVQKKIDNIKAQNTIIENEHKKLTDALLTIESVYNEKSKKLDADNILEHRKQMLGELDEAAKLSKDKMDIAKADYAKQKNETASNANLTPEERRLQQLNDDRTYALALQQIRRETEDVNADLMKKHDALILDSYLKEVNTAKDTYDTELTSYQRMVEDKTITLEQYNQYQIDAETALNEALYQADLHDNNRRKAAGLKHTENQADAKVKELELQRSTPKQIYEAESAANTDKENSALLLPQEEATEAQHKIDTAGKDEENASTPDQVHDDEKAISDGTKDLKESLDNQADIKKEYQDNQKKLDEDYYNQQIDQAKKAADDLLNAVAEGEQEKSEMLQASDQRNIDLHARLTDEQAALAAGGRANNLAQEEAATEQAEEKKQQDAIRAQKVQQGIQLAEVMLNLTAEFAKQGKKNPEILAMTETLAAKGLASAIAGYATGVEGLDGPGTATSDSIIARLSRGESVLTAKGTDENPGLPTAINEGLVPEYFKSIYLPQFLAANNISNSTKAIVSHDPALLKEIRGLRETMENKPTQRIDARSSFRIIETIERNGIEEKINHYRRGGRSRL